MPLWPWASLCCSALLDPGHPREALRRCAWGILGARRTAEALGVVVQHAAVALGVVEQLCAAVTLAILELFHAAVALCILAPVYAARVLGILEQLRTVKALGIMVQLCVAMAGASSCSSAPLLPWASPGSSAPLRPRAASSSYAPLELSPPAGSSVQPWQWASTCGSSPQRHPRAALYRQNPGHSGAVLCRYFLIHLLISRL